MQPETRFKNWLRPRLEKVPQIWLSKIQQVSLRGIPDFLCCIGGKFTALELKVGQNKLEPLQEYNLRAIRRCGGLGYEVHPDNVTEILTILYKLGGATDEFIENAKNEIGFDYKPKVRGVRRVRKHHRQL